MTVAIGTVAPEFTLPSTSGEDVTLSALRGSSVLLAFFPLAFTGTCTAEMCDFSTDVPGFQDVNTRVFGISVDSIPALKAFAAQEGITIELLSDFKREVCRVYGTLIEDLFFSSRTYVIIDSEGVVQWLHTETDLGEKRDDSELLERLAAIA